MFINKSSAACEAPAEFQTLKSGLLTIGTYFSNPPFEYIEGEKKMGYELELMNAVCKRLKLQCRFVDANWNVLIDQLEKNAYDMVMGGMTITPAWKEKVNFSDPYLTTKLSLLIHFEINPEIRSVANLKGRSLAIPDHLADYTLIERMVKNKEIGEIKKYPVDQLQDMIEDVQKGRVDALLTLYPIADYIVVNNKNLKIVQEIPGDPQPLGFAFNKGNPRLLKEVNQVLNQMRADGSLDALMRKWFLAR